MATGGRGYANVTRWGCALILITGALALLGGSLWLQSRPQTPPRGPLPTALIWTATPTPTATPTSTTLPPISGAIESPATLRIGARVVVAGTNALGLNIRVDPSREAERVTVAAEGEVFIVIGGPQEGDSLTWWRLRDETNPQREGWAAGNYLVEEP